MKIEQLKIAYDRELTGFLGVGPRRASPEESKGWEEPSALFETGAEKGLSLRLQCSSDDGRVRVSIHLDQVTICQGDFTGAQIIIEETEDPKLIVFSGTSVIEVSRNPWRLRFFYSGLYEALDLEQEYDDWPR